MTDLPKRRLRWRLSVRALFVLTLLAGIYFACGRMTKTRGALDVASHLTKTNDRPAFDTQFVAPFLYRHDSIVEADDEPSIEVTKRSYYLWLFGYIAQLPIETQRKRPVTVSVIDDFEETYFPVRSSTSRNKTAVPVREWRMQYGETPKFAPQNQILPQQNPIGIVPTLCMSVSRVALTSSIDSSRLGSLCDNRTGAEEANRLVPRIAFQALRFFR